MRGRRRPIPSASSLPPYHPDYKEGDDQLDESQQYSDNDNDTSEDESPQLGTHVRQGSEGYEVRPEGREEMLRKYLEGLGEQPDRYLRYIPQVDEDSESDEDNTPLAYSIDQKRAL